MCHLQSQWRDLTAGFSQWHGTRKGATAVLVNETEVIRNDTLSVVEEIPVDAKRQRMVEKNPSDTSWRECEYVL